VEQEERVGMVEREEQEIRQEPVERVDKQEHEAQVLRGLPCMAGDLLGTTPVL